MGGGPPGFGLGFTCPALLGMLLGWSGISGTGLSPPVAALSRAFPYAVPIPRRSPATPGGRPPGLGSFAFARRYLRNHCCFLFLRVLRCFTSPGVALGGYGLTPRALVSLLVGCPIRRSTDQSVLAAPRGLSQLAASFVALRCQGIRRMPVSACPKTRSRPHGARPSVRRSLRHSSGKFTCQGPESGNPAIRKAIAPAGGGNGGGNRARTGDIQLAKLALYQLSYAPDAENNCRTTSGEEGMRRTRPRAGPLSRSGTLSGPARFTSERPSRDARAP